MRTLVAVEFLSLDGVMQGLGSADEDREGGFEHGGWGAPFAQAIHASRGASGLAGTTAYLFGRKTYEKMASHWPFEPTSNPIAAHMNSTPKHVVSSTLTTVTWDNTSLLTGDVRDAVSRLKDSGEGSITILGSGVLVRELMRADLVDTLRLFIHPLLVGSGKRLFGDLEVPRSLRLTSWVSTPMGSLVVSYDVGPRPAVPDRGEAS